MLCRNFFLFSISVGLLSSMTTAKDKWAPNDSLSAQVWYTANGETSFVYPEASAKSLDSKVNAAIVFTGGGVRSYTCTMGYLAGLRDAGLLDNPRYIGGVSGGSWAVGAYTYARIGTPGVANDDGEFLGAIIPPENITLDGLKNMPKTCARHSGTISLTETLLKLYFDGAVSKRELWTRAISKIYLEPQGIGPKDYYSFDQDTLNQIKSKNPSLANETFLLPNANRPFMVVGTTMIGPAEEGLLSNKNHSYTNHIGTPLYFGQPHLQNVTYTFTDVWGSTHKQMLTVGGLIEPFAVGSTPVTLTTKPVLSGADITVSPGATPFYLRELIGASSFVLGGVTSSIFPASIADGLSPTFDEWPRNGITKPIDMVYADGGITENLPLIPMLRRRVLKIVAFINAEGSLAPASVWNPETDPYELKFMDDYVPGYFGVVPKGQFGYDTSRDQVFATKDFAPTVVALQKAMASGNGAVATTELTTVENAWWGVPAGITTNITWVYLSRLFAWESELPSEIKDLVVPKKNPSDPQQLPTSGPFKYFPHYDDVEQCSLTAEQANLLADMSGWMIKTNLQAFKTALA